MLRLAGFSLALVTLHGCVVDQPVDLVVRGDGSPVGAEAAVSVIVTTGACPSLDEALRGPPVETVVYAERAALGSALPAVGTLEDREYAFTAFFLDDACSVTRHGCVVRHSLLDTIEIEVSVVDPSPGLSCPEGTRCGGGDCVPATSECNEGDACVLGAGAEGICCRGTCTTSDRGSCPTVMCGETARDSANCGECGHVCASALSCTVGLCRAEPAPTALLIELEGVSGTTPGDPTLLVAYAWQIPVVAGATGDGRLLDVTHSRSATGSDGEIGGPVELALPTLAELADLPVWGNLGGVSEQLAFATIVVATDTNDDGQLEVFEVQDIDATAGVFGRAEDVVIVASTADVARSGILSSFFPEGVGVGVLPYRTDPARAALFPTTDTNVWPRICTTDDPACIDGLRNPLSP